MDGFAILNFEVKKITYIKEFMFFLIVFRIFVRFLK